jgi:hypothetical protein
MASLTRDVEASVGIVWSRLIPIASVDSSRT